ncbi:MAG: hypothetical protein AABZ39_16890 [Spirochaetota bacterium]
MSYFSKSRKRTRILEALEKKRVVRAGFRFPLGIYPEDNYLPDEGYTVEAAPSTVDGMFGDRLSYAAAVSAEKTRALMDESVGLFREEACVIIERWSEDVNRDKDVFISREIPLERIRRVFDHYDSLWMECGFVSFGLIDYETGLELLLNDHKVIELFAPYSYTERIEAMFSEAAIPFNKEMTFSYNYDHWHSSLAGLVHEVKDDENTEYDFDYYDIINDLKIPLGLEMAYGDEEEITIKPRWWYIVAKGVTKSGLKDFVQSYYLVAETEEEMETYISDEMDARGVTSYYLYDSCNVNPGTVDIDENFTSIRCADFSKAIPGIWAASEIMLMPRSKKRMV